MRACIKPSSFAAIPIYYCRSDVHDGEWNPLRMIRSHLCILTFPSEFTYDPFLIHFWSIYYIQQISTDINGYTRDPRSPFESPTRSSTRSGRPSVACAAAAVARSWGTEKAVVARSAPRDVAQTWQNHGKTMENPMKNPCKLENLQQFGTWYIPSFDGLFMFVRFTVKFTGPKIGWFLGRSCWWLAKSSLLARFVVLQHSFAGLLLAPQDCRQKGPRPADRSAKGEGRVPDGASVLMVYECLWNMILTYPDHWPLPQASTFDGGKRRTSRSKAVTGVSFVSILAGHGWHFMSRLPLVCH